MNIKDAWGYGRSHLSQSPSPDLDARLLLEHVLQVDHAYLIAHDDVPLTAVQEQQFRRLINRARKQEPIPYLAGYAPFYGLDFIVNSAVLIPRPETEQLVEMACEWAAPRQPLHVVDVGTGSGCIAISLARQLPQANVTAVDISADALTVARQNGQLHTPGRIQFHQGRLLTPIQSPVELIVANLPYVTNGEWTMLDDGVKLYEPAVALKGGDDGLDLIRELLQQAVTKLNPGGAIFLEIGWQQGTAVQRLAQAAFPTAQIKVTPDFAGHDRIVVITTD